MDISKATGIWVIGEQHNGILNPVCLELLGKAKELKEQLKFTEPVIAVVLGYNVEEMTEELFKYGADEAIIVDNPILKLFQNELYAAVLEDLIKENRPSIILMGATALSQDLASILGVRLNTGVAAHCVDLYINDENQMVSVVPAFGGKVLGKVLCPKRRPQIATVKPGIFNKHENSSHDKKVIKHNPEESLKGCFARMKALKEFKEEYKGVPLNEADVIIAGGWGIGSKENWYLIEKLSVLLSGAVGSTRPPVDEGWASESQMIGTSGKIVRPKVYIGIGISGATHHICGMKDANLIISINNDPHALIFEVSDICVEGDAKEILTNMLEELKTFNQ